MANILIRECTRQDLGQVKVIPEQATYLEIENIYLMAEFRDMHVGGDLLEKLLEVAAENGLERFMVST